jgi:flagellar motor protein MotB
VRKFNLFLTVLFVIVISLTSEEVTSQVSRSAQRSYEKALDAYTSSDFSLTITELDKAVKKSPNYALAWFLLAQTHRDLSRDSIAIIELKRALYIDDSLYKKGWLELAELLWMSGDYDSGITALDMVVKKHRELKQYRWVRAGLEFSVMAVKSPMLLSVITPLQGDVNSIRPEYFPSMELSGKKMVFTRLVPSRNNPMGQEEFFSSSLIDGVWREVFPLKGINTLFNEGASSISGNGKTLIFTSCATPRDGFGDRVGAGSCDLFESHYDTQSGFWSLGENIGAPNSNSWESQPTLSSDGNFLVFARALHVRGKGSDLFGAIRGKDRVWGKPFPLPGKINTPYEEESPFLHPDGQTIYFSSNGHPGLGGLDVFVSRKQSNGEWGKPENLGYPLNTHNDENSLMVEPDGVFAIFASDRSNPAGDLDLLRVELPPEARPISVNVLSGTVVDNLSGNPLVASVNLVDITTGSVLTSVKTSLEGFILPLPVNGRYSFEVSCEGYMFNIAEMFTIDSPNKSLHVEVRLMKIDSGTTLSLRDVRFNSGSAVLEFGYQTDLVLLASWLSSNLSTSVEIIGHTDNIGSAPANLQLSEDRAEAVVNFLLTSGISADRLSSSGRGDQVPISTNATLEGKALNRRVEIVVN